MALVAGTAECVEAARRIEAERAGYSFSRHVPDARQPPVSGIDRERGDAAGVERPIADIEKPPGGRQMNL